MTGIYKITSPTGGIYIGRSKDKIGTRWAKYKLLQCKSQRYLYSSFIKHGVDSHVFKVIHELPKDASNDTYNIYEELYWSLYKSYGCKMLNIRQPGLVQTISDETRRLLSIAGKGKKKPPCSQKRKDRISAANKGKISWCKGTKGICKPNSGSFKKGQRVSRATEFQKGVPSTRAKRIIQSNKENNFSKEYRSIMEAVHETGLTSIPYCLKNKIPCGGYNWEFIE